MAARATATMTVAPRPYISYGGFDIGLEQVRAGMAWHATPFLREQMPQERDRYVIGRASRASCQTGLMDRSEPGAPRGSGARANGQSERREGLRDPVRKRLSADCTIAFERRSFQGVSRVRGSRPSRAERRGRAPDRQRGSCWWQDPNPERLGSFERGSGRGQQRSSDSSFGSDTLVTFEVVVTAPNCRLMAPKSAVSDHADEFDDFVLRSLPRCAELLRLGKRHGAYTALGRLANSIAPT
jgi:hypothetical protein